MRDVDCQPDEYKVESPTTGNNPGIVTKLLELWRAVSQHDAND
jgi:hypothetical protein